MTSSTQSLSSGEQSKAMDDVLQEANDRFRLCQEWYSAFWSRFNQDLRFRHGDSDNGWQWPDGIRRQREFDRKPCLTMNVTRQHNLQIANRMKRQNNGVKIIPTGGPATQEAADVYKGIIRCIEHKSRAHDVFSTAQDFQVDGGLGWIRVGTQYCDDDSFDQEIVLWPVNDPLSVVLDPDAQEKDKRDARYGFVFDMVPEAEAKNAYKKLEKLMPADGSPLAGGGPFAGWVKKNHLWICEYFRKVYKPDQLLSFVDPLSKTRKVIRRSALPKEVADAVVGEPLTMIRDIWPEVVEWYLIIGQRVIDKTEWIGKYIPLIPVLGEESIVEGQYDLKGHTRAMKDPQRMYNYNASAQVEFVALQSKTPWIAAIEAIEGYQEYWQSANVINHAVLPYHAYNEEFPEKQIPPPQRQEPPNASPGYQMGMETAFNQMMMTSGQWQNQMGMMGNERTGIAIQERQDQGDTATFHFEDNFGSSMRYLGDQYIDLVPKVMNKRRVMRILAEDGSDEEIEINPQAKQAFIQHVNYQGQVIARIFNPTIGSYGIASDVGPSYASKQRETVDKLTLILTQAPQLVNVIGDLLLKNMDFEDAQEAARRMKRLVPPQALGQGPSQAEQVLTQQVGALQVALAKALEDSAKGKLGLASKDKETRIKAYDAETNRMKALQDALGASDGDDMGLVVRKLVEEALQTSLTPVIGDNSMGGGSKAAGPDSPPIPGAKKAPDGQWYVAHPGKPGKYLRVKARSASEMEPA